MTAELDTLVADLSAAGITLRVGGPDLQYRPRRAMTPALLARLTAHKPALLALLRRSGFAATTKTPAGAIGNEGFGGGACSPTGALSKEVGILATVPAGWTRRCWCQRLVYLAQACESLHPDRAADLRAAVDVLAGGGR